MLRHVKAAAVVVAITALWWVPGASGAPLANRCFVLGSAANPQSHGRFYVKPTGHGILLYDRGRRLLSAGSGNATARAAMPGPAAEWATRRSGRRFYVLRSTLNGRVLATSGRKLVTGGKGRARLLRFTPAHG